MDFRTLGSSLMNTMGKDNYEEYFNRKQLRQKLGSEVDISSTSLVTKHISYRTSSTLTRQQNLEIHIDYVHLSDAALKALNSRYRRCLGIRICWRLMNFESTTPIIQVRENLVRIKDIQKYTMSLNDVFLNHISKQSINFDLYASYDGKENHIGRSEMDLRDFLRCTEKDVSRQLDIFSLRKFKLFHRCQHTTKLGVIALRYCLKPLSLTEVPRVLDKIELEELYYKLHQHISSEMLNCSQNNSFLCNKQSSTALQQNKAKKIGASCSEYCFIRTILDDILNKDDFLSSNEKGEDQHIRKWKNRLNYRKSLEEYAILCGTNPKQANSYSNVQIKVRDYDKNYKYESAIIINVMSLHLDKDKFPLKKSEVREFYVEYSFLSRTGKDMETLSLPLLENRIIQYNFKRTFLIDNDNHYYDCKMIARMVRDHKPIRFMIIEEPIEDVSRFQICKEVGYAEVDLFHLIQTEENAVIDLYPVMKLATPEHTIGYLKLGFWGVQAMRATALRILTPYASRKPSKTQKV